MNALYLIVHKDGEMPFIESLTVEDLWVDTRLADTNAVMMLSAIRPLERRGTTGNAFESTMLILGSADAFHQQLERWYRATALSPDYRDAVQAFLGWRHHFGEAVKDAELRAIWTYIVEAGGAESIEDMSPDFFASWVAYGGYPRRITPLEPSDPTPEDPETSVITDEIAGRDFVLSA